MNAKIIFILIICMSCFLLACDSVSEPKAEPVNDDSLVGNLPTNGPGGLIQAPGLTMTQTGGRSNIVQDIGVDGHWDWRLRNEDGRTVIEVDRNEDGEPDIRVSSDAQDRLEVAMDMGFDGKWQTVSEPTGQNWLDTSQAEQLPELARNALCIALDPLFCAEHTIPLWRANWPRRVLAGFSLGVPMEERELKRADYCVATDDPGCRPVGVVCDTDAACPDNHVCDKLVRTCMERLGKDGTILIGDGPGTPVAPPPPPPPVCGPNVTTQVISTLNDIKTKYTNSIAADKTRMCGHVFSFDPAKYTNAFDIMPLFLYQQCWSTGTYAGCDVPSQASSTAPCEYTVEFGGGCYHSAVVNYMMFGVVGKLCGQSRLYLVGLHLAYDMTKRWKSYWAGTGNKGDPNLSQQSLMMNLGYHFAGGTSQASLERTIAANKRKMQSPANKFKHYYHCALACTATTLQPDPPPWRFTLEPVFPRAGPTPAGSCIFP